MDFVFLIWGILCILISLWFFFFIIFVIKFISRFNLLCINWNVFLLFVFCCMYLLCLIVSLFFSLGGWYFVIVMLFIVFKIDLSLEICFWLLYIRSNLCRVLFILLIVIILMLSILINEEMLLSKLGWFLCILYLKYYLII